MVSFGRSSRNSVLMLFRSTVGETLAGDRFLRYVGMRNILRRRFIRPSARDYGCYIAAELLSHVVCLWATIAEALVKLTSWPAKVPSLRYACKSAGDGSRQKSQHDGCEGHEERDRELHERHGLLRLMSIGQASPYVRSKCGACA
jgi:hypothetical protein